MPTHLHRLQKTEYVPRSPSLPAEKATSNRVEQIARLNCAERDPAMSLPDRPGDSIAMEMGILEQAVGSQVRS